MGLTAWLDGEAIEQADAASSQQTIFETLPLPATCAIKSIVAMNYSIHLGRRGDHGSRLLENVFGGVYENRNKT